MGDDKGTSAAGGGGQRGGGGGGGGLKFSSSVSAAPSSLPKAPSASNWKSSFAKSAGGLFGIGDSGVTGGDGGAVNGNAVKRSAASTTGNINGITRTLGSLSVGVDTKPKPKPPAREKCSDFGDFQDLMSDYTPTVTSMPAPAQQTTSKAKTVTASRSLKSNANGDPNGNGNAPAPKPRVNKAVAVVGTTIPNTITFTNSALAGKPLPVASTLPTTAQPRSTAAPASFTVLSSASSPYQKSTPAPPPPTATVSSSSSSAIQNGTTDCDIPANGLSMMELLKLHREKREAEVSQHLKQQEEEIARLNAPKPMFNKKKVPRAIQQQVRSLPIYSRRDELIELVKKNQFIIVIGETGSGKSTQIPQYLAEAGLHVNGKIGVTQPRRVAARSLALRVAVECGVELGTSVGYAVRFDKRISGETVIKYMTDGLLVKECTTEAALDGYSVIIIDEAHERSIHTDVCFGLLKRAARQRPDLKVIISSATLEEDKFSRFFNNGNNNAPIFNVSGKAFEVDIIYNPKSESDYILGAVDTIISINRREPRGDILVFLSGQDEIEQVWDQIELKMGEMANSLYDDLLITPCYGALPFEDQQKIFEPTPANTRKVVLATNIAETSLTIDGIVYVIDCGYYKQNEYNPKSGIYSLVKRQITTFQAIQRKGRAGRTQPGKCYRLYSEADFKYFMKKAVAPEITRCNIESVVLDIISMGIPDPLLFDFMDPPSRDALAEAIEHLQELQALDIELTLTTLGRRMSEFPLDPPLSKVVISSEKLGCSDEVLKIVALLSTQYQNIFSRSKKHRKLSDMTKAKFDDPTGDMLTLLKVYDAWVANQYSENWCRSLYIQHRHLEEADEIRAQLQDILHSRGIAPEYRGYKCPRDQVSENVRRAFTAGFFRQLSKKKFKGHAYQSLGDLSNIEDVFLHPSSSLFNHKHPWVIYNEVVKTTKAYMRGVIQIEPEWIREYAPDYHRKLSRYGMLI